jgi:cytoskeletal protein CcmA (bactofilin family)
MALVLADRVKETTTTTGTGTYTLAGAVAGFEPFTTIGNGNTTYYACTLGSDFEVGIGTYTASGTTLARTTILQSTNNDNAVNWGAGEKTIFCTQPAEKAVFRDASGHIIALDGRNLTNVDAATLDSIDSGSFLRSDAADTKTSGDLTFSDNVKAVFGTGSDLEIFHDGSNSFIRELGTGRLLIDTDGTGIDLRKNASENLARFITDGAVELYHDNSKKIETTSSGATVTGELAATSLDISGDVDVDGTLEADAMTLNGTAITSTATLSTGISNNNVPKFTSGVADNDFLRVDGTAIEGRSASQVLSDIGGQASLTFGISNTNAVKIDSTSVADDEYARFTANGLESRSTSEVLSDIGGITASSTDTLTNKTLTTPVINGFSGTGDASITGTTTTTSLRLTGTTDVTPSSTGHPLQIGPDNNLNIAIDGNEIQARNNGSASTLYLNISGGSVNVGPDLALTDTGSGSGEGPTLDIYRNSSSPADQDILGNIVFSGENDAGEKITYGEIQTRIRDVTDGTENGAIETFVETNGSLDLYTVHQDGESQFYKDVQIISSDDGATENPSLTLYRNSSSPAANDVIGHIDFSGEDSAGNKDVYAKINVDIIDTTSGSEDARLDLKVVSTGSIQNRIVMTGNGSTQIQNRDLLLAQNVDLIFEGSTNDGNETTLTVTDPTADRTITLPNATGTVLLTDGDGSSLTNVNATTLDSVDSTSFLRSDAADTKTSGNLEFSDNVRLRLGNSGSSDLQIWHNGTNSNIVNGTGDLIIGDTSGDVKIQGKYGEQSIIANNDGSVELYHDNSKKLETASGGISVTGEVAATSLDISGDVDVDGTLEADAMTLNGTAITATATLSTGISNNNVPKFTSGVADNDFLRVDGTSIEGRSASQVLSDIGAQASLTFGISNTNAVKIDSTSVADNEFARFTANGLESRSTSEVLSDLGLGTISTQAADSVNIDGGAIDGVTLGTNSAITEAQIDDFNFNGNSVNVSDTLTGFVIRVNDEFVARFQSSNQTVGGGGLYLYQNNPFITFEGATADGHETNLKVTDPTADRDITLPDASGTVLTTGNSDTPTTTTSSSDADFVLVDDGGTMKKITPANLGITSGGTTAAFATAMAMVL